MAYNPNRKPVTQPTAGTVNKTPAPTTKETTFGRQNYGANAFDGPSSITPGKSVTSPLADDLRSAANAGATADSVRGPITSLDDVIAHGSARVDPDWQTRHVSDSGYPPSHGMKNPNANPIAVQKKTGG